MIDWFEINMKTWMTLKSYHGCSYIISMVADGTFEIYATSLSGKNLVNKNILSLTAAKAVVEQDVETRSIRGYR